MSRWLNKRLLALESATPPARRAGVGRSVTQELRQSDDSRLAAFLAAADRAGLLEEDPPACDSSQFADFVRAARRLGLSGARGSPE